MMNFSLQNPMKNEIDRVVIALPANTCIYSDARFLAIAFDADAQGQPHAETLRFKENLPFLASYEIFYCLCNARAQWAVDQSLVVKGQALTPERYLGLWREAVKQAISLQEFADRYGFTTLLEFEGSLSLRGQKNMWDSSPFPHFYDFEAAHSAHFEYLDTNQRFRVTLDLLTKDASRDAFYLDAFLNDQKIERSGVNISICPCVDRYPGVTTITAQGELF